ncbi:hypothetical protein COF67_25385 [Bacillus toyonensis]|uniref:hypothetical protein n=1 Tax=Bacillus toyonensis TaxID=155322 RepID=UPI000BFDC0CB|nr:hypothetical protein [Bacillus toyonensis]PHD44853.1 hypothetical protein COF67_25385 [Bacillus toyonensis]
MAYEVYYTDEVNKRKSERREEFRIYTSISREPNDYTVYVNKDDVIRKDNSLYVIAGAEVSVS